MARDRYVVFGGKPFRRAGRCDVVDGDGKKVTTLQALGDAC
jgi:hypothetical protein